MESPGCVSGFQVVVCTCWSWGAGTLVLWGPSTKGPLFLEAHMSDLASEASCYFVDVLFYPACGDQGPLWDVLFVTY